MSILRAFVAGLVLVGCASPSEDVDEATPAVDDVVTQAAIREISCNADSRQRHASYHLRLSADGVVRDGTVLRGFSKDSPDYRVDVKSVKKDGNRIRIEMTEGESQVRFTISAAGFAAKTRAALDATVEQTTDLAILDAASGSRG